MPGDGRGDRTGPRACRVDSARSLFHRRNALIAARAWRLTVYPASRCLTPLTTRSKSCCARSGLKAELIPMSTTIPIARFSIEPPHPVSSLDEVVELAVRVRHGCAVKARVEEQSFRSFDASSYFVALKFGKGTVLPRIGRVL